MKAQFEKVSASNDSSFLCSTLRGYFPCGWHFHPEYELALVVHRQGQRFVGDSIANFRDGDLVFVGSNLPHTWVSKPSLPEEPHEAVIVQFSHEFLGESFFDKPDMKSIARLLQCSRRGLEIKGKTRDVVAAKLVQMPAMTGLPRLLALLEILTVMAKSSRDLHELSSLEFIPSLRQEDHTRIDGICHYLHEHLKEPIFVSEIAAHFQMHPRTFRRFFKRALGKTVQEYVNECRIGNACAQLINTNQSVSTICYECGFNSLSHFNHKFAALKKMSPRKFRQGYSSHTMTMRTAQRVGSAIPTGCKS